MKITIDDHKCGRDAESPGIDFGRTLTVWQRTRAHLVFKAGGGSHFVSLGERDYTPMSFYVMSRETEEPLALSANSKHPACETLGCVRVRGERIVDFPASKPRT